MILHMRMLFGWGFDESINQSIPLINKTIRFKENSCSKASISYFYYKILITHHPCHTPSKKGDHEILQEHFQHNTFLFNIHPSLLSNDSIPTLDRLLHCIYSYHGSRI